MAITLSDKIAPPPNSFTGMVDASQVLGGAIGGVIPNNAHPALTGDISTLAGSVATLLSTTGVTAGTYTDPVITVDDKGRITAASSGFDAGSTYASNAKWGTE